MSKVSRRVAYRVPYQVPSKVVPDSDQDALQAFSNPAPHWRWYPPDGRVMGTGVLSWTDGENSAVAQQLVGANQPTYNVADASFNSKPTFTWDGTDVMDVQLAKSQTNFLHQCSGASFGFVVKRASSGNLYLFSTLGSESASQHGIVIGPRTYTDTIVIKCANGSGAWYYNLEVGVFGAAAAWCVVAWDDTDCNVYYSGGSSTGNTPTGSASASDSSADMTLSTNLSSDFEGEHGPLFFWNSKISAAQATAFGQACSTVYGVAA